MIKTENLSLHNMKEHRRKEEIDFAKGLGILLVMLGHSMTLMNNPLNTFILSFHMPLFFFVSGMTIKREYTFKTFIWKKLKVWEVQSLCLNCFT